MLLVKDILRSQRWLVCLSSAFSLKVVRPYRAAHVMWGRFSYMAGAVGFSRRWRTSVLAFHILYNMHGGAVAFEDGEVNYDLELLGGASPLDSYNPTMVHNYEKKVLGEAVSFVQKRPRHEGTPDLPPGLRRRRTYMSLVRISERWWELGDARIRARALRSLMASGRGMGRHRWALLNGGWPRYGIWLHRRPLRRQGTA